MILVLIPSFWSNYHLIFIVLTDIQTNRWIHAEDQNDSKKGNISLLISEYALLKNIQNVLQKK
jgi:hypothetical protein